MHREGGGGGPNTTTRFKRRKIHPSKANKTTPKRTGEAMHAHKITHPQDTHTDVLTTAAAKPHRERDQGTWSQTNRLQNMGEQVPEEPDTGLPNKRDSPNTIRPLSAFC